MTQTSSPKNQVTSLRGIIHETDAPIDPVRTSARPACGARRISGWVTAPKEPLVIGEHVIERRCPKCFPQG